ncbi:MAG: hypothetical protein HY901_06345 [Deltaproteobacteria bacterium]|nr:hypothetical protein [Deltaproteobacteria bacterium]
MGTRSVPAIWTEVSLELLTLVDRDGLHRDTGRTLTLPFLGGRVGEEAMLASDAPQLARGDHLILFADTSQLPYPTLGGRSGILRVLEGRVFTYEGRPVLSISKQGFLVGASADAPARGPFPEPVGAARGRPVELKEGEPMSLEDALAALQGLMREARP